MAAQLPSIPSPPIEQGNILKWCTEVWSYLGRSRIIVGAGLREVRTGGGRIISAAPGAGGLKSWDYEFGLKEISGNVITFNGGSIIVGTEVLTIPETEVTASGGTLESPFFAQVEIDHEDPANSRILPVTATLFQSDGFTRIPLLKCYLESSALKFPSGGYICHVGSILLPSFYSTA